MGDYLRDREQSRVRSALHEAYDTIAVLQRDNEALRRENAQCETRFRAAMDADRKDFSRLREELLEAREQLDRIWDALTAAGHPADGETSTAEMVAAALLGAGQLALDMATDLAAARAKLEECGRDSTRIDWLQAQLDEHGTVWMLPCGDDMRFVQVRNFGECLNYPTVTGKLREALDAALAQDNEP